MTSEELELLENESLLDSEHKTTQALSKLLVEYRELTVRARLNEQDITSLRHQLRLVDNHTAEWFKERLLFAADMIGQIESIMEFHDNQQLPYWALTLHKIRGVLAQKIDLSITRDLEEERFLEACAEVGISTDIATQAWQNWSGKLANTNRPKGRSNV